MNVQKEFSRYGNCKFRRYVKKTTSKTPKNDDVCGKNDDKLVKYGIRPPEYINMILSGLYVKKVEKSTRRRKRT